MRSVLALALFTAAVATPALADPATGGAPKVKKVCHAVNNGNPLFPQMKCHSEPVETAAAPAATAPAAEPASADQATQMAMQNNAQPH